MSILLKQRRLQVSWNQWQPSCFESVEAKIIGTAKVLTEKSSKTEINSFWSENDLKCWQLWKSSEIQNWICERTDIRDGEDNYRGIRDDFLCISTSISLTCVPRVSDPMYMALRIRVSSSWRYISAREISAYRSLCPNANPAPTVTAAVALILAESHHIKTGAKPMAPWFHDQAKLRK